MSLCLESFVIPNMLCVQNCDNAWPTSDVSAPATVSKLAVETDQRDNMYKYVSNTRMCCLHKLLRLLWNAQWLCIQDELHIAGKQHPSPGQTRLPSLEHLAR